MNLGPFRRRSSRVLVISVRKGIIVCIRDRDRMLMVIVWLMRRACVR